VDQISGLDFQSTDFDRLPHINDVGISLGGRKTPGIQMETGRSYLVHIPDGSVGYGTNASETKMNTGMRFVPKSTGPRIAVNVFEDGNPGFGHAHHILKPIPPLDKIAADHRWFRTANSSGYGISDHRTAFLKNAADGSVGIALITKSCPR
jgi:hypothetical protein